MTLAADDCALRGLEAETVLEERELMLDDLVRAVDMDDALLWWFLYDGDLDEAACGAILTIHSRLLFL